MVLSQQQQRHFFEEGFLHLPSFIGPLWPERLIFRMKELTDKRSHGEKHIFEAGEDRQTADEFFLASAHKIAFFFDKNAKNKTSSPFLALNKVGHALHDLCPVYKKFSHQNKFYDLVAGLGLKKPLLLQSMFIFKQSLFGDAIPAHQDATFLYTNPNSVIGLWFALQDADESNGCLWVLPKGHKGPLKNRFLKENARLSFKYEQKVNWPRQRFMPVRAKAGDVVVLHGLLPHLSEQNRSNKTRFAYTIHFIDQKCHYPKSNWLAL